MTALSQNLERAYASNEQTPLQTIEIIHSSLTGGVLRYVRAYSSLTATLEDASTVVFTALGFNIQLPERGTDGRQDLSIALSNISNNAYQQIEAAINANRTTEEKATIKEIKQEKINRATTDCVMRQTAKKGLLDRISYFYLKI